jgi:hypothetical protein
VIMSRYHTGVFSEPHSIAGLAVLFNNQEVRNAFRGATSAMSGTKKIIYKPLAQQNFRLDFYSDVDRSLNYGLVPGVPQSYQNPPGPQWDTIHIHEFQPAQPLSISHPHRKFALGLMALLFGLVVLIVYYKLVYDPNSGFEKFMDSQDFGVRFLFTFVGVMISRFLASIFKGEIVQPQTPISTRLTVSLQDIAAMQAFSNLSHRSAKAQDSILLPKLFDPVTAILPSLLRGHFFTFLVAFSAFLAEPLTICLANIHYKTGTTFAAFTVSTWLSCAIIVTMLITLVGIAFHKQPVLPFKLDTIAAVMYYLSSSSIPAGLKGTETLDTRSRNRAIREMELRYGMWTRGMDGVVTIDVDASLE